MPIATEAVTVPPGDRKTEKATVPKPVLSAIDAIALIVGIVIGAGIFRTPSLVAGNVESGGMLMLAWIVGGAVSLIGALCYAELTTAFPNTGGDYHFLMRAFGKRTAFLFAWARMSVIQTGSIALLAFIFGDYVTQIYNLGEYSSVIYAAIIVTLLTVINIIGIKMGTGIQKLLTALEILGIVVIIIVGSFFVPDAFESSFSFVPVTNNGNSLGLAMVFVLLTFGGWNEAAYISAEIKSGRKKMAAALIFSIIIITLVYILVNFAFLRGLGIEGMAETNAVAGDLLGIAFGTAGVTSISLMVAVAAMTSANATIFTGARSNYALGRDFKAFSFLGKWKTEVEGPVNAFLVQGMIALILVSFGFFSRSGFETMIDYTAPVFWFFLLLVGISLFVLRKKEPRVKRPFRVPFYPILPLAFCITSAYLLYSSIVYTGWGALAGIGVLTAGILILIFKPSIAAKEY
ncbi:amino acid transporter [Salinimicrobium marinum]|uniref:Amino acid transporter n=1 Tax=Salinimicrobium marinum TaxID=680283 RepID=A0A918SB53_9FLAO|nr:amino acid permease [Salinimicrobium marinum]GHA33639.1 amino acid transporter [Salinimicrobium marinum]